MFETPVRFLASVYIGLNNWKSPVWEAESSVSFLHLLFELLDAVQKGHHGVVEFIVPEEPQAS